LRVRDLCHGDCVAARAIVTQQKTQRSVQFEITEPTRDAIGPGVAGQGLSIGKQLLRRATAECGLVRTRRLETGGMPAAARAIENCPSIKASHRAYLDRGGRDQLVVLGGAALLERRDRGGHGPGLELQTVFRGWRQAPPIPS